MGRQYYPLHALHWSIDVFCGDLSAHVSRHYLRLIQKSTRVDLAIWRRYFFSVDGRGVFWLSAALGANVLLGRASHSEFICGNSVCWP